MIITIAHQKGGVGKSTISSNLAVELDAVCVDLDYQRSLTLFATNRLKQQNKKLKMLDIVKIDDFKKLEYIDDFVIIDNGGFDSDLNRASMHIADLIITPVGSSEIELYGLLKFNSILKELRASATILLNRVHIFAGKSLEDIKEFANNEQNFNIFETVLRDRADYQKCFSLGLSVIEANTKAKDEMQSLIQEIKKSLS